MNSTRGRRFTFILLLFFSLTSNAALVSLVGDDVTFTYDDALLGLFGTPTVSGNTLIFNPTTFSATATGDVSPVMTLSTINIGVQANDLNSIVSNTSLTERGDYLRDLGVPAMGGVGPVMNAEVDASGQIRVSKGIQEVVANIVPDDLSVTDALTNWEALAIADVASLGGNILNVFMQNILFADSDATDAIAFIQKSLVALEVETQVIPIPPSLILLGSVLIGLFSIGRRKRQQEPMAG